MPPPAFSIKTSQSCWPGPLRAERWDGSPGLDRALVAASVFLFRRPSRPEKASRKLHRGGGFRARGDRFSSSLPVPCPRAVLKLEQRQNAAWGCLRFCCLAEQRQDLSPCLHNAEAF